MDRGNIAHFPERSDYWPSAAYCHHGSLIGLYLGLCKSNARPIPAGLAEPGINGLPTDPDPSRR